MQSPKIMDNKENKDINQIINISSAITIQINLILFFQPIDIKNIYCLWGKHDKLLNNLQLRFEMALITDFFDYFKQPWAYAIYHDRFDRLLDELNNIMTSSVVRFFFIKNAYLFQK